jgi:hypothetical protein
MPFEQVEGAANPIASLLGLAGGYLAGNPARKAAQAQQDYTRAEKSKEDQRADAELALQTQAATNLTAQQNQETPHDRYVAGVRQNMSKPLAQGGIGPAPDPMKSPPEAIAAYALRGRQYALDHKLDPSDLGFGPGDLNALSELGVHTSTTDKNIAQTKVYPTVAALNVARTQHIRDYAKNQAILLQSALAKISAQNDGRAKVAAIQSAGAYARTQMQQSGANARTQMQQSGANARAQESDETREAIANQAMQLKAADIVQNAATKSDAQYYQNARAVFQQQQENWRNQNTVQKGAQDDAGNPIAPPSPPVSLTVGQPNITVAPGGSPGLDANTLAIILSVLRNPAGAKPPPNTGAKPATGTPPFAPSVNRSGPTRSAAGASRPPADMRPGTVEWYNRLAPADRAAALSKVPADVRAYLLSLNLSATGDGW